MIVKNVKVPLRLTDATWKSWGIAAECLGLSRADLLENLVKQNQGIFPSVYSEKPVLKTKMTFNKDELNQKVAQVLAELQLGKQASSYKLVEKNLTSPTKSIPQTPRSPELNTVEHLWEAIRENYFYNELFDSLEKVIDTLCEGLNFFNSVPEQLKSITYFPHLRITF